MKTLALVSLVQLLLGILGLRRAIDRRIPADVPGIAKRRRSEIADRHWLEGTALSAPSVMLVVQGIATIVVLFGRGDSRRVAARVLGLLGAVQVFGYPLERVWRQSLVDRDGDLMPFTVGGFTGALKMAILGFAVGRGVTSPDGA